MRQPERFAKRREGPNQKLPIRVVGRQVRKPATHEVKQLLRELVAVVLPLDGLVGLRVVLQRRAP